MNIIKSKLDGAFVVEPQVFSDNRGYFLECFSRIKLTGLPPQEFVQHNESFSVEKGVLRGLHYQKPPYNQAKLVRVIQGSILDVIVDIRISSPTFGQWESFELNSDNKKMLYVPRGFAHGFVTLSPNVIFHYLCDNYYNKESEGGIIWNDSDLNIPWQIDNPILSEKDKLLPKFIDIKDSLNFEWQTNPELSEPVLQG